MINCLDKWDNALNKNLPFWEFWKLSFGGWRATGHRAELYIDDNTGNCLPVVYFTTRDKGMIPILSCDSVLPSIYTEPLLDDEDFVGRCGFRVIPNGREDSYIVPEGTYEEWFSKLHYNVRKFYNRCEIFNIKGANTISLFSQYMYFRDWMYERHKDCSYSVYLDGEFLVSQALKADSYFLEDSSVPIAYWLVSELPNNQLYWINTYRNMEKEYARFGLGNVAIMYMVKYAFYRKKTLNMGLGNYQYKQMFNPIQVPVKGIEKV